MGAFYVLFGIGLRQGGDNFLFFLLCGLVPWKWFSSTLNSGSRSIVANAGPSQICLPANCRSDKHIQIHSSFSGALTYPYTVRF